VQLEERGIPPASRASCGVYRLRDPSGMHGRDSQNEVCCDICKTLPLVSLFDESSNTKFFFLSRKQRKATKAARVLQILRPQTC